MQEEVWKDVVGFEQYFKVSQFGKVWSKRTSKILKQTKLKSGYWVINTRIGGRDGIAYSIRVHRMVAEAFLSPPSQELIDVCSKQHFGKVIVRHRDNTKTNNNYDNLMWGTCQDNSDDYVATGASRTSQDGKRGVDNPSSKFTQDQIDYIRANYKEIGVRALAREFSVNHCTISRIVNNKRYK